jgi:hypothetical protein
MNPMERQSDMNRKSTVPTDDVGCGWRRFGSGLAMVLVIALSGCGAGTDTVEVVPAAESSEQPARQLVLSEKPQGDVVSPTDVMELKGESTSAVLAGRVDAGDLDPFQSGEVAFMVSQLPDEEHAADDPDHADNCPFCKRKLANAPKAIVQFRGNDGEVLAGDPRAELGLEKGDTVYVTGTSQYYPEVNTVMVNATGVYRERR